MSFCSLFLVTASRRRACAWDTAARLCVRTVLCCPAFSLAPPLAPPAPPQLSLPCSPGSSLLRAGPTSPRRASSATASGLPDAAPASAGQGGGRDLPVPEQKAYAHARFYDDAGSPGVSRWRRPAHGLLQDGEHRHPGVGLRRSMAGLRAPLSTLHAKSRDLPCMTRGQCGSLHLHRRGLAPPTSCRSPGAPVHPISSSCRQGGSLPGVA